MSAAATEHPASLRQRAFAWAGRVDPGLWVALAIALAAAWPFLTRPSLVTYTDAEMHVYRAAQVEASLRAGVLYPRWAPDFYYGYGYPVFNYYSPLTYHLAAWYSLLTGTDVVAGTKFVLVLGYLLASFGIYLFVRDRWGGVPGAVASVALLFSPYMLYVDPHARGDVPEFFAIALAPMAFWAFSRLRRSGSPGDAALSAVLLGLIIFSHPLMAIAFFGLLLLWVVWESAFGHSLVARDGGPRRRPLGLAVWAILLGLGLAAVLWAPAVLERGAVQLHNVAGPGFFDFRKNFLSAGELFSLSPPFDYGATEVRFNFNLGASQWALASLGIVSVFHPRIRRLSVLFFALLAVGFVYLMLPSSLQFWEAIPPMSYFQFPSRFLGPAAVVLAVLSAASVAWSELLRPRWARNAFGLFAIAACFATALPHLFPRPWQPFGEVSTLRSLQVELDGRAVGTTSGNDFLPSTAEGPPRPSPELVESYQAGGILDKANHAALPAGATVTALSHSPIEDRFEVESPDGFVLRLFTFDFPGWRAYVDGREVPIEAVKPEGFISFNVPAGTSTVRVRFGNTPTRLAGWTLTLLSAAGVAGLLVIRWRKNGQITSPPGCRLARGAGLTMLAGLALVTGLRIAADANGWFRYQSTGETVDVAQYAYRGEYDGNLGLLAYDLPDTVVKPGEAVALTVYWKALGPVTQDYRVYVHLMGPDGALWGQSDKWNPADFPTTLWPSDRYVRDEHQALLSPDAPAGEYLVRVGLWEGVEGSRLNAWLPDGTPLGDGIELPTRLRVVR